LTLNDHNPAQKPSSAALNNAPISTIGIPSN